MFGRIDGERREFMYFLPAYTYQYRYRRDIVGKFNGIRITAKKLPTIEEDDSSLGFGEDRKLPLVVQFQMMVYGHGC